LADDIETRGEIRVGRTKGERKSSSPPLFNVCFDLKYILYSIVLSDKLHKNLPKIGDETRSYYVYAIQVPRHFYQEYGKKRLSVHVLLLVL
jgi:hypothetical protein